VIELASRPDNCTGPLPVLRSDLGAVTDQPCFSCSEAMVFFRRPTVDCSPRRQPVRGGAVCRFCRPVCPPAPNPSRSLAGTNRRPRLSWGCDRHCRPDRRQRDAQSNPMTSVLVVPSAVPVCPRNALQRPAGRFRLDTPRNRVYSAGCASEPCGVVSENDRSTPRRLGF